MNLTTSVVICAYTEDRWADLCSAVKSVQLQVTKVDDLIIVIDHNPELLKRAAATLPEGVKVVANTGPRGLSGARNTGLGASQGDVVLFLDDDAVADPHWVTQLLAPYAEPSVFGVGGSAIPVWEGLPPRWWPAEFLWVVGCSYRGQPTSRSPVRNMLGCNMSIRRTVLNAAAGFDDGLGRTARKPLGCEETELCIRVRKLFPEGMFVLEPSALVHHRVPKSRASWRYFLARCGAEGISKARVAERVGSQAALAEERNYSFRVLPVGIARNLAEALCGDIYGLARAAAIVSGVFVTAARYGGARIAGGRSGPGPMLHGDRPRQGARRLLERLP